GSLDVRHEPLDRRREREIGQSAQERVEDRLALLAENAAHDVDEAPSRPDVASRALGDRELCAGEVGEVVDLPAEGDLGPAAQGADATARGVDEHGIVGARDLARADAPVDGELRAGLEADTRPLFAEAFELRGARVPRVDRAVRADRSREERRLVATTGARVENDLARPCADGEASHLRALFLDGPRPLAPAGEAL